MKIPFFSSNRQLTHMYIYIYETSIYVRLTYIYICESTVRGEKRDFHQKALINYNVYTEVHL